MKKNYMKPQMNVIEMENETALLAGSGGDDNNRMTVGGYADDDDYAY